MSSRRGEKQATGYGLRRYATVMQATGPRLIGRATFPAAAAAQEAK